MKKLLAKLTLFAALCGLAACGSATANLQVFNASPDAPALDILTDGTVVVAGLPDLAFEQYQEVDSGTLTIRANEAGTSRTLAELNATLGANQDYTLIVLNFVSDLETLLLQDDNSIDQASTAKLRLVNASPSAPSLDFYFTAPGTDISNVSPLVSDLSFKEASQYLVVGSSTYQVRVTQSGTKTVLVDSGNFVLSPSQVRTGVVVDAAGGGGPFNIVFLPDKLQ